MAPSNHIVYLEYVIVKYVALPTAILRDLGLIGIVRRRI